MLTQRLHVSENIFKNPHNVYFLVKYDFIFKSTSFKNRIFQDLISFSKQKFPSLFFSNDFQLKELS